MKAAGEPSKLGKHMQMCGLRLHSKQSLQKSLLDAFKLIKVCPVANDGPNLTAITQDWLHQGVKQFAFDARIIKMQLLASPLQGQLGLCGCFAEVFNGWSQGS